MGMVFSCSEHLAYLARQSTRRRPSSRLFIPPFSAPFTPNFESIRATPALPYASLPFANFYAVPPSFPPYSPPPIVCFAFLPSIPLSTPYPPSSSLAHRPLPAPTRNPHMYSLLSSSLLFSPTPLKHTGERPFTCRCSGQFSRLDNLQQRADKHALRHHHFHDHCPGTASPATPASASGGAGKRGNAATKRTRGGGSAAGVAAMGSPYVLLTPIDTSGPPPPRAPTPAHTDIVPLATTSSPRPPCPMGRFCAPPRPPPHAARDPTPGIVRLGSISQDRGRARHLDAENPLSGRASASPSPNPLPGHPWGSVGPELAACAKVQRYRDVYAIQIPATPIGARRPPSDEVGIRVELVERVGGMFDLSGRERAAGAVWAAGPLHGTTRRYTANPNPTKYCAFGTTRQGGYYTALRGATKRGCPATPGFADVPTYTLPESTDFDVILDPFKAGHLRIRMVFAAEARALAVAWAKGGNPTVHMVASGDAAATGSNTRETSTAPSGYGTGNPSRNHATVAHHSTRTRGLTLRVSRPSVRPSSPRVQPERSFPPLRSPAFFHPTLARLIPSLRPIRSSFLPSGRRLPLPPPPPSNPPPIFLLVSLTSASHTDPAYVPPRRTHASTNGHLTLPAGWGTTRATSTYPSIRPLHRLNELKTCAIGRRRRARLRIRDADDDATCAMRGYGVLRARVFVDALVLSTDRDGEGEAGWMTGAISLLRVATGEMMAPRRLRLQKDGITLAPAERLALQQRMYTLQKPDVSVYGGAHRREDLLRASWEHQYRLLCEACSAAFFIHIHDGALYLVRDSLQRMVCLYNVIVGEATKNRLNSGTAPSRTTHNTFQASLFIPISTAIPNIKSQADAIARVQYIQDAAVSAYLIARWTDSSDGSSHSKDLGPWQSIGGQEELRLVDAGIPDGASVQFASYVAGVGGARPLPSPPRWADNIATCIQEYNNDRVFTVNSSVAKGAMFRQTGTAFKGWFTYEDLYDVPASFFRCSSGRWFENV
ncbi:hypothetical protein DFH09DRAFT_1365035 [Mycena vulgaris]|nr:hypothetical protein DFH09DRAFT_1365035 [Mycena vulgaris]